MGEFEFPTMGHVWLAQRVRGAEVQFVSADGNRIPAANYEKMVDRNTLIVPLTHVCFKNGFRSEVNAITQIAHDSGALVMLDDYQDCGTRPVDVKAMDLDFFVTGTLKYLLGPPGLAFMYVRKELISSLAPTRYRMVCASQSVCLRSANFRPVSHRAKIRVRFSVRAQCVCGVAGIRTAARNRYGKCGRPHQEPHAIAVDAAPRIWVFAPKRPPTAQDHWWCCSRRIQPCWCRKLAESGIVASNRHDGLRISFHVYNTMDDVKAVVEVLKKNIDLLVLDPASVGSHD